MPLGPSGLRDGLGRSGLLDKAGRCARSLWPWGPLTSHADAAMRSVLIRLCLVAVYVSALRALGTDAPVSDLHVIELGRSLSRVGLDSNGITF